MPGLGFKIVPAFETTFCRRRFAQLFRRQDFRIILRDPTAVSDPKNPPELSSMIRSVLATRVVPTAFPPWGAVADFRAYCLDGRLNPCSIGGARAFSRGQPQLGAQIFHRELTPQVTPAETWGCPDAGSDNFTGLIEFRNETPRVRGTLLL